MTILRTMVLMLSGDFVFPYWQNLFISRNFIWKSIVFIEINRTRPENNVGEFAHVHQFYVRYGSAGCDSSPSISVSTSFPASR